MNPAEYFRLLAEGVRYRVRFRRQKWQVMEFVVQLEVMQEGQWCVVVRYDTSHGFAHRDSYRHDGSARKHEPMLMADFNEALTYAIHDVTENWSEWLREFGKKMK